jgi:hypothetical protein
MKLVGGGLRFRDRALPALGAALGAYALPAAYLLLDEYGPASRFQYWPYLPLEGAGKAFAGAVLGALGGCALVAAARPSAPRQRAWLVPVLALAGSAAGFAAAIAVLIATGGHLGEGHAAAAGAVLVASLAGAWAAGVAGFRAEPEGVARPPWRRRALLVVLTAFATWIAAPQVDAFPARASIAQRDAWTRRHVRGYPGLTRLVARIPAVRGDVGDVVEIAPTATDAQSHATTMDGDDMRLALEVVGSRGRGTLRVESTFDGPQMMRWEPAEWSFGGRVSTLDVAALPGDVHPLP